jgi:hypothetical protein
MLLLRSRTWRRIHKYFRPTGPRSPDLLILQTLIHVSLRPSTIIRQHVYTPTSSKRNPDITLHGALSMRFESILRCALLTLPNSRGSAVADLPR